MYKKLSTSSTTRTLYRPR